MVYFVDYLKKVGFKLTKTSVALKENYRFPTLSCKLEEGKEVVGSDAGNNFVFSLSYFISDDFSKQSLEFSFEDWYNWKRKEEVEERECRSGSSSSSGLFETIEKNVGFPFFQYFSITETLLTKVYQSRLKGRKSWKKRNWKLSVRWANVYKAFGCEKKKNVRVNTSPDLVKVIENIIELDKVMQNCIVKAAKDYSYAPFDVYFDCYKKKLKLEKIVYNSSSENETRVKRDTIFKDFSKKVLELQKG